MDEFEKEMINLSPKKICGTCYYIGLIRPNYATFMTCAHPNRRGQKVDSEQEGCADHKWLSQSAENAYAAANEAAVGGCNCARPCKVCACHG